MPWAYASSRVALTLRRLRGRFGISAPQMAIRTHVPWRFKAFRVALLIVVLLGLTAWIFDFGRQIAGIDKAEISALRTRNALLEEELAKLRSLSAACENDLQIERATQKLLTEKQTALLEENRKLQEEVAVLERFSKAKNK
jgi:hypothetical protein